MRRFATAFVLTLALTFAAPSFGCSCRLSNNVSKYLKAADIVFMGKVVFTDDDGSGTFVQKTLVHFGVEETFKGLSSEVHDVWVDPGSLTSCYAEYQLGARYLVFAYGAAKLPVGTPAMTVLPEE